MNNILSQSNILYTSIFLLFLTYIGYKYYKNNGEEITINETSIKKEEPPRITSKHIDKYIQREFSKVLKIFAKEVQNTAKSMSEFNHDFLLKSDYLNFRNSLFTKDIEKFHLLIDSKNINHSSTHNTSQYTIFLDGDNASNNDTSGYGRIQNVIGLRLLNIIEEIAVPKFKQGVIISLPFLKFMTLKAKIKADEPELTIKPYFFEKNFDILVSKVFTAKPI